MKTASEILSALVDEGFVKKAKGYSSLFDSWTDVTEKNGIASAAAHSRIKDLDRGILLVEMDHPGWKQILQTKQSKLLSDYRRRFPELDICGISLILGKYDKEVISQDTTQRNIETLDHNIENKENEDEKLAVEHTVKGMDAIKDEELKKILKNLGETVAKKNKK